MFQRTEVRWPIFALSSYAVASSQIVHSSQPIAHRFARTDREQPRTRTSTIKRMELRPRRRPRTRPRKFKPQNTCNEEPVLPKVTLMGNPQLDCLTPACPSNFAPVQPPSRGRSLTIHPKTREAHIVLSLVVGEIHSIFPPLVGGIERGGSNLAKSFNLYFNLR